MRRVSTIALIAVLFATPVSAELEYHVVRSVDAFTDEQICKTVLGTDFSRGIAEGMLGWYGVSYFFVERKGNEIAAGITNDRNLPVAGNIQIRVDDGPVTTITPADTPEDMLPASAIPVPTTTTGYPEVDKQISESMRIARAQLTPFRVVTGDKARSLLAEIINGHHAIWRSVTMLPQTDRGPAEIRIDGLKEAVAACGIDLTPQSVVPTTELHPYVPTGK
jgi:hypothetical protein